MLKVNNWLSSHYPWPDPSWWYVSLSIPVACFMICLYKETPEPVERTIEAEQQIMAEGFVDDSYDQPQGSDVGMIAMAVIIGLVISWQYMAFLIDSFS
ncbi:MAG: hypothetical protein V1765_03115 [bacterium]